MSLIESVFQDLHFAVRTLGRNVVFTVVAIISLALGIGANTSIFSIIDAVLLRSLPFQDPERVVMIWHKWEQPNLPRSTISPPAFADTDDLSRSFEYMAASASWTASLAGQGEPEQLRGRLVSSAFFRVLGVQPALGRLISEEDDYSGAGKVVVLSDGFWRRRFGSDANLVGRQVRLDDRSYTVIGILPRDFEYPGEPEIWAPIAFTPEQLSEINRGNRYLSVIARLKNGVSVQQTQTEMNVVAHQLKQQFPRAYPEDSGFGIIVEPFREYLVGDVRPTLLILFATVGIVLLIVCANVANLLLARSTARQKEISVRMALGGSRSRLIRQLLTESILLALLGGIFGAFLAVWGIGLVVRALPVTLVQFLPYWDTIGINLRVLAFTFLVSLATAVIMGLMPALQASNLELNQALKKESRGATAFKQSRIRNSLVVAEIALTFVLLTGAGLLIRSFFQVLDINSGFRTENLFTMQLTVSQVKYPDAQQRALFFERVVQEVATLPGIESAGMVTSLPLTGAAIAGFIIEGRPVPPSELSPRGINQMADTGFFRTMGIPVLRGRAFSAVDRDGGIPVVIIDDAAARRFWPNEDPIGKRLDFNFERLTGRPIIREIVGIVGHVQQNALDAESMAQLYMPMLQTPTHRPLLPFMYLVVRTSSDPVSSFPTVRNAIRTLDQDVPVSRVMTMDRVVSDSLSGRRLTMLLMGLFAAIALILTIVGIFGLIAYGVTQRTHEIGIRMALGAQRGSIFRLFLVRGMFLAVFGVSIGLAVSLALTRVMARLLYGITATDPATFILVSVLMIATVALGSFVPARSATQVDPMQALRVE